MAGEVKIISPEKMFSSDMTIEDEQDMFLLGVHLGSRKG